MRGSLTHRKLMLSAAAFAMLGGSAARAADLGVVEPLPVPVADGCRHMGMVSAGGGATLFAPPTSSFDDFLDDIFAFQDHHSLDYQAEAAWLGTCGQLNFQFDGAFNGYSGSSNAPFSKSADGTAWHVGGIMFRRQPSHGLLGLDGSYIGRDIDFTDGEIIMDKSNSGFRIGARGEFFASDRWTIGGRAGYFDFNISAGGPDVDFDGFEGDIFARYYANENFALTGRADGVWTTLDSIEELFVDTYGLGVTVGGEYLISDTKLSLYAEGSFYHWNIDFPEELDLKLTGIRGMVGATFYIGTNQNTLVGIHRNGPLDNTSFWWEESHGPIAALFPSITQ